MLRTNWATHDVPAKRKYSPGWLVLRPTGQGELRRRKITGTHKTLSRSDREALCRKLEGSKS
jgi:hypothetical protein